MVQGASGSNTADDPRLIAIGRDDCKELHHATKLSAFQSILMKGGLFYGGLEGAGKRNRIYCSVADWTKFPSGYQPSKRPHTKYEDEPYFPRDNWGARVVLNYPEVFDACGPFKQSQTYAGMGPLLTNVPFP